MTARCRTRGRRAWVGVCLATAALHARHERAAGQQVQEPDSARLEILQRLERLGRPVGYDTVLFRQDSLRAAEGRAGRPAAGRAGGADSTRAQLAALEGFTRTEFSGASASFEVSDRLLVLHGADGNRARVTTQGQEVRADSSITFDDRSGLVRTVGASTYTPPEGDAVESARLVFDVSQGRGSAFDAKTEYTEAGARWYVNGDMPYAATDSTFLSHARFTSCDLTVPHYHFETDQIKIIGGKVLVARPVRLYFADVPVAWLPFVAQSLGQGRSSGLLTPRFSFNDIVTNSRGYNRRVSNVGFYWAMSQYSDALVAFDWYSNNFVSMTGGLQYRFSRQFLNGGVNFRRYWKADGSTELALDTRNSWEYDERTQLRMSARYAASDFVRGYSFNPREVTQSIDSDAGLNRRFDWGTTSLSANRKKYLSDDRTEWTLPSASLSLSTITLFRAPTSQAHFWNNMTWAGGTSFNRRTVDRLQPDTFAVSQANTINTGGRASSNLSMGRLSLSQSLDLSDRATLGVPDAYIALGDTAPADQLLNGISPARDIAQSELTWRSAVSYQQQLIGSTTLTPSFSVNGKLFRADTSALAQSFVSAPTRMSLSALLKTDIYGFYPGFGGFEAIRHKLSPSFTYAWSPETSPSALQRQVFRSQDLQRQSIVSVTLNQTWEAKRSTPEGGARDTAAVAPDSAGAAGARAPGEPRRAPRASTVKLLGLTTTAVTYDFVEADSTGFLLGGFRETLLGNTVSSDYLRGLSLSFTHNLFEDSVANRTLVTRRLAPHLQNLNLSFSLGSSSSLFRWLGLLGGGSDSEPDEVTPGTGPGAEGPTDEASIIPGVASPSPSPVRPVAGRSGGTPGGWNASIRYALQRPRAGTGTTSQMLSGTLTLRPTQNWSMSWQTSYDLEANKFNDHSINLSRDLHRWEANFRFSQTATGNWTFRFDVALIDNRDLKFDYNQRNLEVGRR